MKSKRSSRPRGQAGSLAGPRTRVGMQRLGDSVVVAGGTTYSGFTTLADGTRDGIFVINPSNEPTAISNIADCYELYKVDACTVDWIPVLGMTNGGRVTMAYLDNPEHINRWGEYTATVRRTIIMSNPRAVSGKITDRLSFTVPCGSLRRKWFQCDRAGAASTLEADRVLQGAVVYYIVGAPAATDVGAMRVHYNRVTFKTMVAPMAQLPTLVTGIESTQDEPGQEPSEPPPRFPWPGDTLG